MNAVLKPVLSKCPIDRTLFCLQILSYKLFGVLLDSPLPEEAEHQYLSLARRAYERPGLIINPTTHMAWRPYENLINGELDNRTPGKVSGWMCFYRSGQRSLKVSFDLTGDFHEDIRGKVIRLSNTKPTDRNEQLDRKGTYMEGFASVQRGEVGDITAGLSLGVWTDDLAQKVLTKQELIWEETGVPAGERDERRQELAEHFRERIAKQESFYPYVPYPYIEWYSEANGRVVLELEPEQVEILPREVEVREKTAKELAADARACTAAMGEFLRGMATELFRESRPSDRAAKPEEVNE